jgi:putative FmdB family regulatory protein
MPEYPYLCGGCGEPWTVIKSFAESSDHETCPGCGIVATEQDFEQKNIGGYVNSDEDWSSGKVVVQLGPNHPDRMVTSKHQMEKVYQKHDISMDTGHFKSEEAQIKATVPINKRRGGSPGSVSGVKEES